MRILLAALALVAPLAFAVDPEFAATGDPNGPFYIVLTKEPCPADLLAKAPAGVGSTFYFARERFQGRDIRACWVARAPIVVIFDEDGGHGALPMSAFHKVDGV